jgi:hypothetical protein
VDPPLLQAGELCLEELDSEAPPCERVLRKGPGRARNYVRPASGGRLAAAGEAAAHGDHGPVDDGLVVRGQPLVVADGAAAPGWPTPPGVASRDSSIRYSTRQWVPRRAVESGQLARQAAGR